jgi:hypothetical protein
MAMLLEFTPTAYTTEKYDTTIRQLEEAGQGAPAGRLSHVAYGDPNALRVTDVWESQEAFEAFGRTLIPILQGVGVDPGQPKVTPLHNVIVAAPVGAGR